MDRQTTTRPTSQFTAARAASSHRTTESRESTATSALAQQLGPLQQAVTGEQFLRGPHFGARQARSNPPAANQSPVTTDEISLGKDSALWSTVVCEPAAADLDATVSGEFGPLRLRFDPPHRAHSQSASAPSQASPELVAIHDETLGWTLATFHDRPAAAKASPPRPAPMSRQRLVPGWTADRFAWPAIARELVVRLPQVFDILRQTVCGQLLVEGNRLAVSTARRYVGGTTLAISLATALEAPGMRVLLVDADIARPSLTSRSGLTPFESWHQTEPSLASISRCLVGARNSGTVLMPLRFEEGSQPGAGLLRRLATLLQLVQPHFDLVIVDAGPISQWSLMIDDARTLADGLVLVHDAARGGGRDLGQAQHQAQLLGMQRIAAIENFSGQYHARTLAGASS